MIESYKNSNEFTPWGISSIEDLAKKESHSGINIPEDEKDRIFEIIRPEIQKKLDEIFNEYSGIGECLEITIDDTARIIQNYHYDTVQTRLLSDDNLEGHTKSYNIKTNDSFLKTIFDGLRVLDQYENPKMFGNYAVWRAGHSLMFTKDPDLIQEVISQRKDIINLKIEELQKNIKFQNEMLQELDSLNPIVEYYKTQDNGLVVPNDIDLGLAIQKGKIEETSPDEI